MGINSLVLLLILPAACRSLQVTIALKPDVGTVGDSVQFLVSTDPHNGFTFISWTVNGSALVTFDGTNTIIDPDYRERINFNITSGSLEMKSLTLRDSGSYQINIKTSGESAVQHVTFEVLAQVSDVIIQANATELVEFNDSVSLTCSASGSSPTFHWLNGSSDIIVSERVHLSAYNRTLTISPVLRTDQKPIYCSVTNIISSNTSRPITFNVSFGPDNVAVTVSPPGPIFTSGTNLTLSCSAQSSPPAQFQWALNDTLLSQWGDKLQLTNIKASQSGNYTCWAHNNRTLRYHLSEPSMITVLAQVSDVIIQANATELVEFNDSVSLTCSASGSSPTFHWLNDSSDIIVSERVHLSADNRTLTISPVLRSDQEPIYCSVTNIVSNTTRKAISININFGPDNVAVTVSPPGPIFTSGTSLILSCSAQSKPPAQFQWALNDTLLSQRGDKLQLMNIKGSQSGNYTCWAHNTITQRYHSSESSVITVLVIPAEGGVLSGGAIAGIVIGVLLALGLFPAGFFIMKKLRPGTSPQSSASNSASQNSARQQTEMTYAEVSHAKPNGGAVQQGHQSSQANQIPRASPVNESATTIYSHVNTNR
ncbi:cell adhesion molecule CEACAM5-like [Paramormyrops kingsleyae]|uniref:cell adhesion molecule CEACAM5-like n=1 Tax=Paramormyrops kingsleyae TaxID=1676925 RepID=UPI003B97754C